MLAARPARCRDSRSERLGAVARAQILQRDHPGQLAEQPRIVAGRAGQRFARLDRSGAQRGHGERILFGHRRRPSGRPPLA